MSTMNYSCLYLTELQPIEKCVNLQHFVTERVSFVLCTCTMYNNNAAILQAYIVVQINQFDCSSDIV